MKREDFRILKNIYINDLYRVEVLTEGLWSRIKRVFMPNAPHVKKWKLCGEYSSPYQFYSVEKCNRFIEDYIRLGKPHMSNWEEITNE